MPDLAGAFPYRHFEAYLPPDNPTFHNPSFDGAPYRVLIARLSPFRDVDRSIPHLYLYHEVRRALPAAYVDLAFFPGEHERATLAEGDLPHWIGTQSLQPASAFDLILISNAYTLELINLPYLLLRSGIPLYASKRDERWPILLLGGSNAMASQAVIRTDGDSLVDGIYFGEGEGGVERLVAALAQGSEPDTSGRGSKQEALARAAAAVDGLWVAGSLHETRKAVCTPDARYLATGYPLLNTPEAHAARLQINYGCPAFCSFCFEGYDRKPYRELSLSDLLDAARCLKRAQGVPEVSLYSFNFNTHAEILPMLLDLHLLYHRVGVQSQRADILQHAGYLLEAEVEAGKRSLTVGVEGISERQRAWLHKSLPTADLLALLDRLFAHKIRELKLFFMLTGHETDDDIEAFRDLIRAIKEARRARGSHVRVIFSFGLLVRMPFTPLRYDRLSLDEAAWRPLLGQVKSACETNGFEFRMAFDWDVYCVTQVLAMGGYWLIKPLVELARQGHCFDAGLPPGYWDQLRERLVEAGHWNEAF
ncbi:MAG TPA: radical SAM protein, partial [Anaerolineae bacterium]|nr:radical SAM protein [Anaerolineae bacterium]